MTRITCFLFLSAAAALLAAEAPLTTASAPLVNLYDLRPDHMLVASLGDVKCVSFKLRLEGASFVRVNLADLRLAEGEKLWVASADGRAVYGPVSGAGPRSLGRFSSGPIPGNEIVVEWQTNSGGEADIPFRVESIEAAEAPEAVQEDQPEAKPVVSGTRVSLYRGVPLEHEVIDGMAVYQGDIILGSADELVPFQGEGKSTTRLGIGNTALATRWPNGIMPYEINPTLAGRDRVTKAIEHWNAALAGVVKLVPRTTETKYVIFMTSYTAGTCSSGIGMGKFSNYIQLDPACGVGNIIHEIGHAWGLWHEHTREDRDRFVRINWQNVKMGQEHNFKQNVATSDDLGSYDYASIMHYGTTAFTSNGQPTITTIPAGISVGQRSALSAGDIAAIKLMYPVQAASTVATPTAVAPTTTVTADPIGTPVLVDGVQYTTPARFAWVPGSSHTLSAVDSVAAGTRRTFVRWSNGGARTHSIAVGSQASTYTAQQALAHAVNLAPTVGGTTAISPAAADRFYAPGTAVTLTAVANPGYCFAGWTGLLADTPPVANLSVTKPYDISGRFVPGDIIVFPERAVVPAAGGSVALNVSAVGCKWTAQTSGSSWLQISNTALNSGPGQITVVAAPNPTSEPRTATITIGPKTVTLQQAGKANQQ